MILSLAFAACSSGKSGFQDDKSGNPALEPPPAARLGISQRGPVENLPGYEKTMKELRAKEEFSLKKTESNRLEAFQSNLNSASFDGNNGISGFHANVNIELPIPVPARKAVHHAKNAPKDLFKKALTYYKSHPKSIKNKKYLGVIDYARKSTKKRFFIMNMETGEIKSFLVAHGKNSDPNNTGFAKYFSNRINSRKTSLGFYLTLNRYRGKHGLSLKLKGLSPTNSNAFKRAIVIHGAKYVTDGHVGRSWGCPAVKTSKIKMIVNMLEGGALIYAGTSR